MANVQLKAVNQRAALRAACGKHVAKTTVLSGEAAGSIMTGKAEWGGPAAPLVLLGAVVGPGQVS